MKNRFKKYTYFMRCIMVAPRSDASLSVALSSLSSWLGYVVKRANGCKLYWGRALKKGKIHYSTKILSTNNYDDYVVIYCLTWPTV